MKVRQLASHLIVLSAVFLPALGEAQTFKVRVLDALNGKPYDNFPVYYFCSSESQNKIAIKHTATDSDGFAEINYECTSGQQIDINTGDLDGKSIYTGKVETCGWLASQTIEQILNVGVISEPTADGGIWCPARVSKKMKPIPGQVIIFVKKPTWWQKHVAP